MQEERVKYANSVLTSRTPFEVAEIVRIRLSQAKIINGEFYTLFKELSELKKSYVQQLRKIIIVNEDLDKLVYNGMVQRQVLTAPEMAGMDFDWLGELRGVWQQVIRGLKADMHAQVEEYKGLDRDVVGVLRSHVETDEHWREVRKLHPKLSRMAAEMEVSRSTPEKVAAAERQWVEQAPRLLEVMEATDEKRLLVLKNCLLQYQNLLDDSLHANLDESEKVMERLLEFTPDREIDRFASAVVNYDFRFEPMQAAEADGEGAAAATPVEHRLRHVSGSSMLRNLLSNDTFSDASNNVSLVPSRKSKLKSKVGSIFGRRRHRRAPQLQSESIPESDTSSLHSHGTSSYHDSELYSKSHAVSSEAAAPRPAANSNNAPPAEKKPELEATRSSFSINQAPLVPQPRSKKTPEIIGASNVQAITEKSGPADTAAPAQNFIRQRSTWDGVQQDPTALHDETNIVSSLAPARRSSAAGQLGAHFWSPVPASQEGQNVPSLEGGRRDIHSMLFTNLSKADIDNSVTRHESTNSQTSEMRQLEPQQTGSSLLLMNITGQSLFQHTELTSLGLNASIGEVINAKFKDGILSSSQLIGEIALNYISSDSTGNSLPLDIILKIESAEQFDKIIVNHTILERTADENNIIYKLAPQFIFGKTLGALKYSLKSPLVPIAIHPVWRFEQTQASVMLTLKIFSGLPPAVQELVLEDLIVSVAIDNTVAKSALSKPQGSFSKEKRRITWRFKEPLVLRRDNEERLVARFLTEGVAQESQKGVQAKFTIRGLQLGGGLVLRSQEVTLEDPFGSETADIWNDVTTSRTLVAGAYYGLST
ncbi:AEL147Wp [Eremothecium gossypii ATCC 10895]|uniref:AEL147Wp n=1 Tax=Eremothecium gossypii (strain ATCC 10895 / CBS 109.51 / FGSC 9923 / NRRL Y-1056) TaxID=284811 RepID=Q758D3_EREGS|nr:AEL147Wp [Eremothecium gossypii ATCC 10895]AAS52538.1 AEL147Wp [Eremothecium gossypii ATCC 10895]AEY96838.1 FAEL147Wp [Eremothecium gossypii FDAG1]